MNFQDEIKVHKVKTKLIELNTELSQDTLDIIQNLEDEVISLESEREHLINEVNTLSAAMT